MYSEYHDYIPKALEPLLLIIVDKYQFLTNMVNWRLILKIHIFVYIFASMIGRYFIFVSLPMFEGARNPMNPCSKTFTFDTIWRKYKFCSNWSHRFSKNYFAHNFTCITCKDLISVYVPVQSNGIPTPISNASISYHMHTWTKHSAKFAPCREMTSKKNILLNILYLL